MARNWRDGRIGLQNVSQGFSQQGRSTSSYSSLDNTDREFVDLLSALFDNRLNMDKNDIHNLKLLSQKQMWQKTKLIISKIK